MKELNRRFGFAPKNGALRSFVLVIVVMVHLAVLMALSTPSRDAARSVSSNETPTPAVSAVGVAPVETGVPDAQTVFANSVDTPEEALPTF